MLLAALVLAALAFSSRGQPGDAALQVAAPGGVRPLGPFLQTDGLSFQQTWVVSPNASDDRLRALRVDAVARVAVEYAAELPLLDAHDALAVVVVYGDSPALVQLIEPSAGSGGDALAIGVKNQDATAQGLLFTQVYVREPRALRELSLSSSAEVVVGDGVLATVPDAVALTNQGSGSIGVKLGESLNVDALDVAVGGSGNVHVKTPVFQASKLSAAVSGAGSFKLYAREVVTPEIEAAVSGSGGFELKNNDRPVSTCSRESIEVQGSGSAKTGAVVCDSVAVRIAGSGSALVHASRELSVDVSGSGHVKYVGSLPPQVTVAGGFPGLRSKTLKHKSAKEYEYKDKYSFKTLKHRAQRVTVHVAASPNGKPSVAVWSPPDAAAATIDMLETDPSAADATQLFAHMTLSDASSLLMPSAAAAGAAFVLAAGVAVLRLRRHQGRGYHAIP